VAVIKNFRYDGSLREAIGLSSDDKPTDMPQGSIFRELDTGNSYAYLSISWYILCCGKTFRELVSQNQKAWIESVFIDFTADGIGDIDTTYKALSKIYTPIRKVGEGTRTLDVVAHDGFTGMTSTMWEVIITKAGDIGTAEFKWRKKTYLGDIWGDYSDAIVTAVDNDELGNGVEINFDGSGYLVGDKWLLQASGSWHTPASGKKSFFTSLHIHLYDTSPISKAAKARAYNGNWRIWDLYDYQVDFPNWRTPIYLLGDGALQHKVEFAEKVKGDIEFLYLTMKGWEE